MIVGIRDGRGGRGGWLGGGVHWGSVGPGAGG